MGNFAVNLVQTFFSVPELLNRKCRGTWVKEPLQPTKLARVRECTFLSSSTLKKQQWKKCIIEIDENLRWEKKEASNL